MFLRYISIFRKTSEQRNIIYNINKINIKIKILTNQLHMYNVINI